ncbi:hypothetical protein SUDANB2_03807 [Streptomyces sp. enrichment culture]
MSVNPSIPLSSSPTTKPWVIQVLIVIILLCGVEPEVIATGADALTILTVLGVGCGTAARHSNPADRK